MMPWMGKTGDGTGLGALPPQKEGLSHLDGDETDPAAGKGQLSNHERMPGGMGDISGNRTKAPFGTTPYFPSGEEGGLGRGGSGVPPLGRAMKAGRSRG